jgi:SAM-dependent methyltransferase
VAGTPWDAGTYDRTSEPQQAWASEVVARLDGIAQDATVLDVGCGTGRVTEALLRTSILAAHLERLPEERRERFAAAVVAGVRPPLDYVRLNASAVRGPA